MLNDSMISQSALPQTPNLSLWDRLTQGVSSIGEKLRARFEDGVEEFHYVMDLEKLAQQPQKISLSAPAIQKLAGFLVDDSGERPMPLWEGANYFRVSEKGLLAAVTWTNENDYDYEIRVTSKGTLLERIRPTKETRMLETNDSLSMGTRGFLLKMLPEEYRRDISSAARCFQGDRLNRKKEMGTGNGN